MFRTFKLWHLAGALRTKGNSQAAYSAVLELGQLANDKALDLLVLALARADGVARSAARELGKMGNDRAIPPLVGLLSHADVSQAATEALLGFGNRAVGPLLEVVRQGDALARAAAAGALGEIRDKRAVEPLVQLLQADDEYAVRVAAATALGNLKDSRAVWVLVATLSLRDETTPERQAKLASLRQACSLALRKIGDPLAARPPGQTDQQGPAAAREDSPGAEKEKEKILAEPEVHPRLRDDLKQLGNDEIVEILRDVIAASEEISWAQLERRQPLLPAWFSSYEQRSNVAARVGRELFRRGGAAHMRQLWEENLDRHAGIRNWWSGIGDWA